MANRISNITRPEIVDWLSSDSKYFELLKESAIKRDDAMFSALITVGELKVFCKCFPLQGLKGKLQHWFGKDRARRLHQMTQQLHAAGAPVAESWGYSIEPGRALWFSQVLPFKSLLHWCGPALPGDKEQRKTILDSSLAAMVALHRAGFFHGDFKWGNLLFDERNQKIWLVDLDRVKPRSTRQFDKSAARDVARFMLDCEEAGMPKDEYLSIVSSYAERVDESVANIQLLVEPIYNVLKARHDARYGAGFRLSPPAD
ncbi:lipopolysaccharide kinase InaA family protein [Porticoccaceae bacterium LTM1]|nr:lipopolysaccharide kinase InaA family protein [Porticoccaceae bacterium LTM1]